MKSLNYQHSIPVLIRPIGISDPFYVPNNSLSSSSSDSSFTEPTLTWKEQSCNPISDMDVEICSF